MEKTIKETRGTVGERQTRTSNEQLAFVNALKALDDEKMEQAYQRALRDIAETVLGMDFENNCQPSNTDVQ